MADTSDQDSKTQEPTEKKIRDALEQGKIPVSRETSIFASMAALLVILAFLIHEGVQQLAMTLKSLLDDPDGIRLTSAADANGLLSVIGLDCLDGTPLIDIKPYFASTDSVPDAVVGWHKKG